MNKITEAESDDNNFAEFQVTKYKESNRRNQVFLVPIQLDNWSIEKMDAGLNFQGTCLWTFQSSSLF